MSKKQQKKIKIKPKNMILMSEKISVTLINKGFSQKYGSVKVSYPLKQGLLSLPSTISIIFSLSVKVSYPLKQGLQELRRLIDRLLICRLK